MKQTKNDVAILFFSRSSAQESRYKSLLHGNENIELLNHLRNRALSVLKEVKLPFFEFDECQQSGDTFGERIANAFAEVFSLGYKNIISIGGDCPDLNQKDIVEAAHRLNNNDVVLGPDERGGAYLIGLSKRVFRRHCFQNLSWQSNSLVDSFNRFYGDIYFLQKKFDLNDAGDILQYGHTSLVLQSILQLIFSIVLPAMRRHSKKFSNLLSYNTSRRGPPTMALKCCLSQHRI